MDTLIWGYLFISIILGTIAIYMRENMIFLVSLITVIILLKIFLFLSLNKTVNFLRDNFTQIVNGQLNINIKRSNIKSVNQVGEKINEYLEKIRKLLGEYINTSEITDKESESMKTQAE
ncbi:MAG: Cache sensor-containing methyl-accepting chemotaxis sensory transducer, partial [Firmicutes bacterium]|nr:Cache sensor-containing methyl-accepting chemotaxis sensory transducer [Bacillota bacterium]